MMWTQSSFNFLRSSPDGITRVHDSCLCKVCTLNQTHNELSHRHQAKIVHFGRLKGPVNGSSIAKIVSVMEINGIALTIPMNPRVTIRFPRESGIMAGRFGVLGKRHFSFYKIEIKSPHSNWQTA